MTAEEHERIRRPGLALATTSDLLAAALEPWVAGRRFLVGGDWNTSPLFDTDYPNTKWAKAKASTEFFERRKTAGWWDAMRRFHEIEVRTYLDPTTDHARSTACSPIPIRTTNSLAVTSSTTQAVTGLSDHAPVVIDVAR